MGIALADSFCNYGVEHQFVSHTRRPQVPGHLKGATMATQRAFDVDVQDVEYQKIDGKSWLARVYQPKGDGPFPAMIDVHGGAWNNGDRTNNAQMDEALA